MHILILDTVSVYGGVAVAVYYLNSNNGYVEINSKSYNRFNKYAHEDYFVERKLNPPSL